MYGIMHSALKVFGMTVEWGVAANNSIVFPRVDPQAILASIPMKTQEFRFRDMFLHPINTGILLYDHAQQALQNVANFFATHFSIGEVSVRDLKQIAEICTK